MSRILSLLLAAFVAIVCAAPVQAQEAGDVAIKTLADGAHVRFTLITAQGFVSFAPGADWKVLGMQNRSPVLSTVFQIPDAADDGTPDSTNLILSFFQPDS